MLNLGTSWHNVKNHVARAWTTSHKILSVADRYADIAHRVLNTGVLGQQATAHRALSHYGDARTKINDYRDKGLRMYNKVKNDVPELEI